MGSKQKAKQRNRQSSSRSLPAPEVPQEPSEPTEATLAEPPVPDPAEAPVEPLLQAEQEGLEGREDAVVPAEPTAETGSSETTHTLPKKQSCIDAAYQVLLQKTEPMTCPELIDVLTTEGIWSSPKGKTPANTLYASILREIKLKESKARFRRIGRGKFAANAPEAS